MAGPFGDRALEIFDVQEDQSIAVFLDRLHRISAALLVVRRVELQLDVARIRGVEDPPDFIRAFAQVVHVIVEADRDAEIGRALSDLGQQLAKPFVVLRDDRTALRALVGQLQVEPADVLDELRVPDMLLDLGLLRGGVDPHVSARERDHRQAMFLKEIAKSAGAIAVGLEDVRPQLDAGKTERGDVLDRLDILAAPGDGGVAERDSLARPRDQLEVGENTGCAGRAETDQDFTA